MKIEKANAGNLTNLEVFEFLKSKGAKIDPIGCVGLATPPECKVFEYLTQTPASIQTKEIIDNFHQKSDKFKLTNNEILNIVNTRPTGQPELYAIIKECGERFVTTDFKIIRGEKEPIIVEDKVQEILELIEEILPQMPEKSEELEDELNEEELNEE